MPIYSFKPIKTSEKLAHQQVEINGQEAGDVWREFDDGEEFPTHCSDTVTPMPPTS